MAAVAPKPLSNNYPHIDPRRHSSAHPTALSPPVLRNGSVTSTKSQPAWMSSIQERDRQGSSQPQSSGLKGLFGRKKPEKKQEKIVLGSKHAVSVKSNLKADPRGARKHPSPSVTTAGVIGTQKSAHLTAEQQEMRHPHSGPPALRAAGELPMLTRIVSGDEDDEWDHEASRADWEKRKVPEVEKVLETHGEEERVADVEEGGVEDLQLRRRSLLDVEIKGGEGLKPARRKTVFGGWAKDGKGVWHRG
jgi:hypothetical protein